MHYKAILSYTGMLPCFVMFLLVDGLLLEILSYSDLMTMTYVFLKLHGSFLFVALYVMIGARA